ncbi:polar amino acid transport system substrate-binding protein [Pseudoalteromonas rubra]|uniref:Polar amino acid transport system substrate-binding protein n=1 Tax=Pseudoalteromonas rubra TaxID=43658 RepID=A0A8T0C2C1_9GAMM|nr:transporter substrate-binding domain-containing protein [Pseudoalteromonas rubra]KAF7781398.1 polar amino acid transport system substrate-binding protein [Pseudoalteromonas rubra]
MGGPVSWWPIGYINEQTDKAEGISFELLEYIGEQLNLPVWIAPSLPWKRVLKMVEVGQLDVVSGAYKTAQRSSLFQYSEPYYRNEIRVFVHKDRPFVFEKLEHLKGRVGLKPLGGSFGQAFDSFAAENKSSFVSVAAHKATFEVNVLRPLIEGLADYFVLDYQDGLLFLQKSGLQDEFVALPHPVAVLDVHLLLSRHSWCANLLPEINQVIAQAKRNGKLANIIAGYSQ